MSAFACEPGRGSEAGVGWHWALQAARDNEVWLITSQLHRDPIERELARRPCPNLHVVYHYPPWWKPKYYSGYLLGNVTYRLWQLSAIPLARRLHQRIGFDLGHQITYVTFRHPTFLAWLDIPFIWGPIGGGELAPLRFYRVYGASGNIREVLRAVSVLIAWLDPTIRLTARKASVILAVTPATRSALPAFARPKARVVPAIGIAATSISTAPELLARPAEGLKLIFVGNLLYLKGVQLALRAIELLHRSAPQVHVTLTLVGEGADRANLQRLTLELGVAHLVDFKGQLAPHLVHQLYKRHDVLVFPSFTDSGGFVLLEAMAAGLPIICLDLGGPALVVTDETGIRVPAHSPEQAVSDLANAIRYLATNEVARHRMGMAALERVRTQYSWEQKRNLLRQLYDEVARNRQLTCPI